VADIHRLPEFKDSVQNEYWQNHPDEYRRFCVFFGFRISMVDKDELNEDSYIAEWKNKHISMGE